MDQPWRASGLGQESRLSALHLEILPDVQRQALAAVAPRASGEEFYLAGGTAVALHLGHRQSVDLDWFTATAFEAPLDLAGRLQSAGVPLEHVQVAPGTLHGRLLGVRTSFLRYHYPLLRPTVPWPEFSCALASIADLACMKLAAVAQRGARKDFLDVFALGHELPLGEMLALYQEKYRTQDIGHVLAGLCYFDDADREPSPVLLRALDWDDIKATIRGWVKASAV